MVMVVTVLVLSVNSGFASESPEAYLMPADISGYELTGPVQQAYAVEEALAEKQIRILQKELEFCSNEPARVALQKSIETVKEALQIRQLEIHLEDAISRGKYRDAEMLADALETLLNAPETKKSRDIPDPVDANRRVRTAGEQGERS